MTYNDEFSIQVVQQRTESCKLHHLWPYKSSIIKFINACIEQKKESLTHVQTDEGERLPLSEQIQPCNQQHIVSSLDPMPRIQIQSTGQFTGFSQRLNYFLPNLKSNVECSCQLEHLLTPPEKGLFHFHTNHLTLPLCIGVCKSCLDSLCVAPICNFSLSTAFFISSSSCLQFSSWDLLNILIKLIRVEITADVIQKSNKLVEITMKRPGRALTSN